jgi:hypothetical protein
MTTKRAKTEKTKTGVTARTPETKATPPPAILLTRDQFTGDPIADHAAEGAALLLPVLRDESKTMEPAWRACCKAGGRVPQDLLNKALVRVASYPEDMGLIGMDCATARKRRDVALARDTLERLLRRALAILGKAATECGGDPAAIEAGGLALREAYKPHLKHGGTATGIPYPRGLWPACMDAESWGALPEPLRSDIVRLRDAPGDLAAARAAESLRRLSPDNAILRTALCNAMTEKTEAIRKATPDQSTWTPMQRQWLALRVTKKGEAVKYGEARWLAQREIGAALGVSAMAVQRMETAMEKQPDVRAFLAVLRVPLRKPRGIRKATVTKRKKSRRA